MALSEFRDTHSWQGAIKLGPHLSRLADDLPASEEHGLAKQLRKGAVELAATIAADLQHGAKSSDVRLLPALRLVAALELIDKIYPALDTAAAREAVDALFERLTGPAFDERRSAPKPPAAPAHPAAPAPRPEPASVPVMAEAAPVAAPAPRVDAPARPEVTAHDSDTNPALKVSPSDEHQSR